MGGLGSGKRWKKKTVVEVCLRLVASDWMRKGVLKAGMRQSGTWQWTFPSGQSCAIEFEANTMDLSAAYLRVMYALHSTRESFDYRVRLATTRPQFGGLRWWFICPLSIGGQACGRRVGKLYAPPKGGYFGCRHCHALTYTTCQQNHASDRLMNMIAGRVGIGLKDVKAILKRRRPS